MIDSANALAETFLSDNAEILVVSDFGIAEFASAVARRVRMGELTRQDGQLAFLNLDAWVARTASRQEIVTTDIRAADAILRRPR